MKPIDALSPEDARAATIFRALGNPARMQIVREIAQRNTCITSDLVDVLPLAQSTISEHLRVLRDAGLIMGVIEGDPCFCLDPETLAWLRDYSDALLQIASAVDCPPTATIIEPAAIQ